MAKLTNLQLAEFSIVHGDKEPANPGAMALVFKAGNREKKETGMTKTVTPDPARQTLAQKIGFAVRTALGKETTEKGVQTRTSVSESRYEEKWDDGRGALVVENPDGSVSVTVTQSQGDEVPVVPEPVVPVQQTIPVISEDVITSAITKALAPIQQSVAAFDSRVATLENRPVGTGQIAKSTIFTPSTNNGGEKFPHFTKALMERNGLTPGQRLTKAAITAGSFTYGLHSEEADRFIDYIVDESVLFKSVRQVRINGKEKLIPKIGLGSRVFRKGTAGTDPGDTVSISTSQIAVSCPEIVAIVRVADDSIEDNIEGEALVQHLLTMIGSAGRNELEAASFHGDTAVADANGINDRFDGFLKKALAGGHVVDATGDTNRYWPGPKGGKASRLLMTLPTKFRRNPERMRWLMHPDVGLNYNDVLATLGLNDSFAAVTGIKDVPLRSIPIMKVAAIRQDLTVGGGSDGTVVMLTDLQNLIFAISRDITIESQRVARARSTDFVISMRCSVEIENVDAVAVYNKAKVNVPVD